METKTVATSPLLTRQEAARWLRQSPKTLANWAAAGSGPAYRRIGRRALYFERDLQAWVEAQTLYEDAA